MLYSVHLDNRTGILLDVSQSMKDKWILFENEKKEIEFKKGKSIFDTLFGIIRSQNAENTDIFVLAFGMQAKEEVFEIREKK